MYNFSDSIQRGIIYLLKSDKEFFVEIINLIKPEYFEFPSHQNIYNIVVNYYTRYKTLPTDAIIIEELKLIIPKTERISDYEDEIIFINRLDVSHIEHREYFLDLIEKFARKEAVKHALAQSIQLVKDNKTDEIETIIKKALTISRNVNIGASYFEEVSDRWERLIKQEQYERFKCPVQKLNESLEGGLCRGEYSIVVAASGRGKSLWLANQAVTSLKEGRKVLYITLEMSEDKISQRIDSMITLIPQSLLKTNVDKVKERLNIFKENFPNGKLIVKAFHDGQASVNTIRALLVQLYNYEGFTPDVILIDYLELLTSSREGLAEYQSQEKISRELDSLSREYNCVVHSATQCNRVGVFIPIITEGELADSYGKIRPAHLAISLNQTEEEYDSGIMRLYKIKDRNNRCHFTIPMSIDYSTLIMSDLKDEQNS